ncbi:MAG: hypothetical protein Q9172_003879 [Xanthocarpia lactea]
MSVSRFVKRVGRCLCNANCGPPVRRKHMECMLVPPRGHRRSRVHNASPSRPFQRGCRGARWGSDATLGKEVESDVVRTVPRTQANARRSNFDIKIRRNKTAGRGLPPDMSAQGGSQQFGKGTNGVLDKRVRTWFLERMPTFQEQP